MSDDQVKQFIDQATQSLQGGQFQQALELVEQAIALKPDLSEAFVLKGIAESQLGDPEAATEAFRRAIMLAPYNVKAYFNLAVHYYSLGQKSAAEEMAREAVRIEPKHAGARDLLARIEAERPETGTAVPTPEMLREQSAVAREAEQPGPGKEPPSPMASQPPTPPQQPVTPQQPYAGAPMTPPPSQPAAQPYYRPGYESSGAHSISFVANLGKNWTAAGWGLAIVSTIAEVIAWGRMFQQLNEARWDFMAWAQAQSGTGMGFAAGDLLLQLISLFLVLLSFIWMIMELSDRRGNWLWLLPFVICCCCGLYGPVMMIYLAKGRE